MTGLYGKYDVRHADGSPLSPGFVFLLRPDRDLAAYDALMTYAASTRDKVLADDLYAWLGTNSPPVKRMTTLTHEREAAND